MTQYGSYGLTPDYLERYKLLAIREKTTVGALLRQLAMQWLDQNHAEGVDGLTPTNLPAKVDSISDADWERWTLILHENEPLYLKHRANLPTAPVNGDKFIASEFLYECYEYDNSTGSVKTPTQARFGVLRRCIRYLLELEYQTTHAGQSVADKLRAARNTVKETTVETVCRDKPRS